jgi:hypothetical protein
MRDWIARSIVLLVAITMLVINTTDNSNAANDDNPLLAQWEGPYGGIPPFVAERLRKYIFAVGNTTDPAEGYRAFRGRDPKIDALMKKRGFAAKS